MGPFINPNCAAVIVATAPGKRFNLKPSFFIMIFYSLIGLLFSISSNAQTTPENCTQGCTSNDVQIHSSYLSNAGGVQLDGSFVCPVSGVAQVYLTLELTTNTPRKGVAIYTNIRTLDANGNPTGNPIATLGQCFGIELNQPTNKVTFQQPFNWQCGTAIALTDVFIAWGTGNKNFCTGTGFQCPATPSKCFQLPSNSFIAIVTPEPVDNSDEKCSTDPGGTTAVFNLNSINVTNSSNVTITWWENYTPPSTLSNQIATPGSYNSISKDVYAKIANNSDPSVFSVATVTLTVVPKPLTLVLTGSSICAGNPNTGTVNSSSSESGVSYQLKDGSNNNVQAAKTGTGSGLTWTGLAAENGYHVVSTRSSAGLNCPGSSNSVNVTSVANPVALVLTGSSICVSAPGTGTVTSSTSQSGVSYQLKDGSNANVQTAKPGTGSGLSWTDLPAGNGYHVVSTGAAPTNCTGSSNIVNVTSVANPDALDLTGSSICTSAPGTGTVSSSTSQSGVSYQLKNSANADVQTAKAGTGSGLSWTGLPAGNGYYVVSTGAAPTNCPGSSNSVNVSSVENPGPPAVTYNAPVCDATTFSVTVTGVINGATYTIKDKNGANIAGVSPGNSVVAPNTNNIIFSNIPAGSGYQVTVQSGSCSSNANSCGEAFAGRSGNTHTVVIDMPSEKSGSEATVKAFPNPFNNQVRFVVSIPEEGNGSLEVYNMMGQKVQTVYQGYIAAGTRIFEMNMPAQKISNMIYIFRMGDKQVTGKLVQMGN